MPQTKPKYSTASDTWKKVLSAEYPMVELYKAMARDDQSRLELALNIVRHPARVAEAFVATIENIGHYANAHPFHEERPTPTANEGELRATKDVALRLGGRDAQTGADAPTRVDVSGVRGATPGELDLFLLDREVTLTRTTKAHREAGVVKPATKLQVDLLLATPDGTIGVGEVKIGNDRDLFYALIQALAGVALVATTAQIQRIVTNYGDQMPSTAVAPGPTPKLDLVLLTVPNTKGETYLTQLNVLARGFVPELLAQPEIGGVLRQISCLTAALTDDEQLALEARWVERSR